MTFISSITSESGREQGGKKGSGELLRGIIYLFFSLLQRGFWLSSSHGKFLLLHYTLLSVNYSKSFRFEDNVY